MRTPIVFFDLETGGLDPQRHPIVQIAAVAVAADLETEIEAYEAKILFDETKAEPEALAVNHYDAETWKREGKPERVVAEDFAALLRKYPAIEHVSKRTGKPYSVARLCGHNAASFDGPFLQAWYRRLGLFLPADPRVLCTCQLAMWSGMRQADRKPPENYKLETLCGEYGIAAIRAHDALADVRATAQLARLLLQEPVPA